MTDIKLAVKNVLEFLNSMLNDKMLLQEMERIGRLISLMKQNFSAELKIVYVINLKVLILELIINFLYRGEFLQQSKSDYSSQVSIFF